jgi:protocatechuate 3,4-dioxygenase beta subunit
MQPHQCALVSEFVVFIMACSCCASQPLSASGQQGSKESDQVKFTEAPGEETEAVKKLIDQAKAALESAKSATTILTDPSFLAAHEWPRFRKLIRESAPSGRTTIVPPKEPGQPLTVTGRVVDGNGEPVTGALLYFYQTSAKGWYSDRAAHIKAVAGDAKHARLFGYLKTDGMGRFELRTIRPVGFPDTDLPAHIHVEIHGKAEGPANIGTEIRFDDDPRLTPEWRKHSQQAGFVIAKVKKDSEDRQQVEVELKKP